MSNKDILDKAKRIHFVGIGGSGMCSMAEIMLSMGFELTGSDIYESDTLDRIKEHGIPVSIGHKRENVGDADLVVYSAAVQSNNPELIEARERHIPLMERAVLLGILTQKYKMPIAVSGTHGKTTTTAMLTQILVTAGYDPSAVIGGKLSFIGGNGRVGKSDIMVCEACEYVDTFLQLSHSISIVLNIDADHLDYFGSLKNIQKSFNKFISKTNDVVFIDGDDRNIDVAINGVEKKIITFGMDKSNDYHADNIVDGKGIGKTFSLISNNLKIADISLKIPGMHNVYNALAAASVAHYLGVNPQDISKALGEFSGVHRRFEVIGDVNGITVIDDFAHHPTEIKAVLTAAKGMNFKRVITAFQPHTYSRTYMLIDDFAEALSIADKAIISEILAVRETNIYDIYAEDLCKKIKNSNYLKTFEEISDFIVDYTKPGDLILTMGGGNVYKCADMIIDRLRKRYL